MDIKSNRAIISKAAITSGTTLATSGKLNPEQANQFIDYMVKDVAFLGDIRTINMNGPQYDLDFIGIANRIIRKGVENTEPTNQPGVTPSKKQLTTTEIILPQDITIQFIEDNIEKENAEDHIARLLADQFANDVCDLAINGDTASVDETYADFLKIGDGFVKLAKDSTTAHKYDTNGSQDYKGTVFKGMLSLLPGKFKRNKSELRFYCSPNVADEYIDQLTVRQTALADELLQSGRLVEYKGVRIFPVEYWPDDVIILTPRQNLAIGVQREFTLDRERKPRKRVIEYTLTSRIDPAKIVWDDALVVGYGAA